MTYKSKRKYKKKDNKKKNYVIIAGIGILVILLLFLIFYVSNDQSDQSGKVDYDVGDPGAGVKAPNINLPSTDGSTFDLSSYKGQTVLLYFQEGIMCQACWVQLKEIEDNFEEFENIGIDQIVTITTDPIGPLTEMVRINNFNTPVVSDDTVTVSKLYNTNLYGMPGMGTNYNGHSFILVDEEGIIKWRADYGKYTMYVPLDVLISDIKKG
ncbi:peroxiredoxin family protein [Haloplasma contractile]|uniref:Antioxidant AhpC-TSA family protein n=1 Tax=Haloplasma contractile SSD-17B TaxID=1033810 RepID=F7PW95_9MOLU|nr:redoxin domain-containing protein [Haloplasma contractile]ERJ11247.1 Antioxidant AhpC-TSA family protein [Haloplasma contractile SSD-17B]